MNSTKFIAGLFVVFFLFASGQVMAEQVPPGLGTPGSLERGKATAAVTALIDYIGEVSAIPAEEIEPRALASSLGAEPSALFAWVRDNTSLVAYRGTLRGAEGVMIDRVGNSLDRSLLLAALFQAHGVKTRLARGQIDADSAQALLIEATGQWSGMAVGGAGEDPAALKRILVEQAGLNPDAVDQRLAILGENQTAATGKANTRLRTVGADVLTLALPAAEGTPESRMAAEIATQTASLRDHWWLQYQRDGKWIDADVTLANPGERRMQAATTLATDKLPLDQYHAVTFRVTIEAMTETKSTQTVVLETKLAARDLVGRALSFTHQPLETPSMDKMRAMAGKPDEILQTVAAIRGWVPILTVDGQPFADKMFRMDGSTMPADGGDLTSFVLGSSVSGATTKTVGGASDMFATMPSGHENAEPTPVAPRAAAEVTAAWLDIEFQIPGHPVEKHRRIVFDLFDEFASPGKIRDPAKLGKAKTLTTLQTQRRALALLSSYSISVQPTRLSPAHAAHLLAGRIREIGPLLLAQVSGKGLDENEIQRLRPKVQSMELRLTDLSALRWAISPVADLAYIDRPNLTMLRNVQEMDDTPGNAESAGDRVRDITEIDIVANGIGVRALPGLDPFQVRLMQGIADTVAEAAELPSETGIGNTAVRHEESLSANVPWQLVNASHGSMSPHDFGGMAAQYMGVDLAGGKILLAAMTDDPRAHVTWWRIDPRTGATLGMTDRGTGGVSAEQTSLLLNVGQAGMCIAALGKSMGDRNRTGSDLLRFGVFLLCGSGTMVSAYYGALAGVAGTTAAATAATNISNIGTAVAMIGAIVELSLL